MKELLTQPCPGVVFPWWHVPSLSAQWALNEQISFPLRVKFDLINKAASPCARLLMSIFTRNIQEHQMKIRWTRKFLGKFLKGFCFPLDSIEWSAETCGFVVVEPDANVNLHSLFSMLMFGIGASCVAASVDESQDDKFELTAGLLTNLGCRAVCVQLIIF